jgi:hypothetical protein
MLKIVVTPKTSVVALAGTVQFAATLVDEEFLPPVPPQPLTAEAKDEWADEHPNKTRLDTLPVGGEHKRQRTVNNPSFSGVYKYPPEEVQWLEQHPGKTHGDYEAFKHAPPLPAPEVKWSATSGSIDDKGLFTAPNSDATATVKAESADNEENFGTAVVTVGKGAPVDALKASGFPRKGFTPAVPLTTAQMKVLADANVPAETSTSPLTRQQAGVLAAAGVPATQQG